YSQNTDHTEKIEHMDHLIIKKEEPFQEDPKTLLRKKISPEKEKPKERLETRPETRSGAKPEIRSEEKAGPNQKRGTKQKAQNRIKNFPGLVVQRVRSSIKLYLSSHTKGEKETIQLAYIGNVLDTQNKSTRDRLLSFLEHYQK